MRHQGPDIAKLDVAGVQALFSGIGQGFCLCEAICDESGRMVDYRFLAVNELFEGMTGLRDAPGRSALELVPDLESHWIETYARVAIDREPQRFRNRSVPMGRWFEVYSAPVEPRGCFAIVFRDVSDEVRLADEHETALGRAEALLEELNHRVKNSLGMIAAIISLEARSREKEAGRRALERIASRVHAVGDLYRTLNSAHRAQAVRADEYLGEVVRRLAESVAGDRVGLEAEIEPLDLPTEVAVPLGLMVNELVTNSLKYAFPEGRAGVVRVSLRQRDARTELVVEDDGNGFDGDAPGQGIGRKLVEAFAAQIGGAVETHIDGGTAITVHFPLPAARGR